MTVQILKPDCNLETIRDGRGGIFTWIPKEPIVEFNMLYFNPGKVRGFHFHPHFIEYLYGRWKWHTCYKRRPQR